MTRFTTIAILGLVGVMTSAAEAQSPGGEKLPQHRQSLARARTIRQAVQLHQVLRTEQVSVLMPPSHNLADHTAKGKKYGDSFSCRESTKMLLDPTRVKELNVPFMPERIASWQNKPLKLELDSVGKKAFLWGSEGWVSFHYFAVDNIKRPTVLLDPTASTNFASDLKPSGLLLGPFQNAGRKLGHPGAANRVIKRIMRGGVRGEGLLVLANPAEIAVYKEALEQAHVLRLQLQRNAQLRRQHDQNL